jgi:hypothetical protein
LVEWYPQRIVKRRLPLVGVVALVVLAGLVVLRPSAAASNSVAVTLTTASSGHFVAVKPRQPTFTDMYQLKKMLGGGTFDYIGIVGNFAVLSWSNKYVGGTALATNLSGSWVLLCRGHGGMAVVDMLSCAKRFGIALDVPTAQALVHQVRIERAPN